MNESIDSQALDVDIFDLEKIGLLKSVLHSIQDDIDFSHHLQMRGVNSSIQRWATSSRGDDGVEFRCQYDIEQDILKPSDKAVASYILRKLQTVKSLCLELTIPYPEDFILQNSEITCEMLLSKYFDEALLARTTDIIHVIGVDIGGSNVSVSVFETKDECSLQCTTEGFLLQDMTYSDIFKKSREIAESLLGFNVWDVFVSLPMRTTVLQRIQIREAAFENGMHLVGTSNSPQLACLLYSMNLKPSEERQLVVCDIGHSSWDAAVFSLEGSLLEVKSISYDSSLGGNEFDDILVEHFKRAISDEWGAELIEDPISLARLRSLCRGVKERLSSCEATDIEIESTDRSVSYKGSITREAFEELCADTLKRYQNRLRALISSACVGSVDDLLLIGGACSMPMVRASLSSVVDSSPARSSPRHASSSYDDSGEAGSRGAALLGAARARLLPKNSALADFLLVDVIAHDICLEVSEGMLTVLVKRNSPISCMRSATFTTTYDNQRTAIIHLLESNDEDKAEERGPHATSIGWFLLEDIPPMPAGVPKIVVRLDVNVDYKVLVQATEEVSGVAAGLVVTCDGKCTEVPGYFNMEKLLLTPNHASGHF